MKLFLRSGLIFFISLHINLSISAQSDLVTWPLINDYSTVNFSTSDIDNASYLAGSGVNEELISLHNLGGDWWNFTANTSVDSTDYVQFEISPKTGANAKNIYITGIEFELMQIPWNGFAGPTAYHLAYSKSSEFISPESSASGAISTSFTSCDVTFPTPLEVFSGETIYFRIYGYGSDNWGDMIIKNNDFSIKGFVEPVSVVNPIPELSFQQTCASEGNLIFDLPQNYDGPNETLLIFAKANSPINLGFSTALLSDYPNADADLSTFSGSSYQHDANAHLVYRGDQPGPQGLINMNAGTTYYFIAFNFLNNGGTGNISGATFSQGIVSGTLSDVTEFLGVGSSHQTTLNFSAPLCADAVMIVAKTSSISGTPSGDGSAYLADSVFTGNGTDFDGGKVVFNEAVPSEISITKTITELTNGTTYYFKAFVRKGESWSSGIEITTLPNLSPILMTQIQSRGDDFFEFMTLQRMDLSTLNITDQGVCSEQVIYRSFTEWEYEEFFSANGNPDVTSPLTDVPAGTFIQVYSGDHAIDLDYSDGLIVLRDSKLNFDQTGDQVLIYTDPLPGDFTDCTIEPNPVVYALDFASTSGFITAGLPNDNTSYRPDIGGAYETLNSRPNSRIKNSNFSGNADALFLRSFESTNWQHQNRSTDYWQLKKMQFHASNYASGEITISDLSGSEVDVDLSGLVFDNTNNSTRYLVAVSQGETPNNPSNRYSCYQPNTNYLLADTLISSVTGQFPNDEPCGISRTKGNAKVVYFDYDLPSSLNITGLECSAEYTFRVYAINGNGVTTKRGTSKNITVLTTQDAEVQSEFYSTSSGNLSDAIWAETPAGSPDQLQALTPCTQLIVQSGHQVVVDIETSVGDVIIESGAQLELIDHPLSVQKNMIINGDFIHNQNSVLFNGSAGIQEIQTSSEVEFFDLIIDKSSVDQSPSVHVMGDLAIRNHISITSGNLAVSEGMHVRLISDAVDQAASITAVPENSEITGNFIVERYLPPISTNDAPPGSGNGVGWRYLAAPIKNATFEIWNDDFITTGLLNSNYPEYPYNINPSYHYFPNLQFYDETVGGSRSLGFDGDAMGGPPTIRNRRDISESINPGQGVFAYIGPVPLTFNAIGEVFHGDLTVPLSYTNSGSVADDGWHLVANPYPSAIHWDQVERSAEVSPFAYIYDATHSGNFIIFEAGSAPDDVIASSNAFWIKTSGAGSISFKESHKSDDINAPFYKTMDNDSELNIVIEYEADSNLTDYTRLRIRDEATLGYDFNYDAFKWYSMNPYVPGLATQIDTFSTDFSINAFNLIDSTFQIPLKANIRTEGTYELSFDLSGEEFYHYCMTLIDLVADSQIVVTNQLNYSFYGLTNQIEDSARFLLEFRPTFNLSAFDATCYNASNGSVQISSHNSTTLNYSLFDNTMDEIQAGVFSENTLISGLAWGNYSIEVSGLEGYCSIDTRDFFIGQPAPQAPAEISTYDALCKSSSDGELLIQWEDSAYYQLYLLYETSLIAFASDASSEYYFDNLAQGNYELLIEGSCDSSQYAFEINHLDSMVVDFVLTNDTVSLQDGGYVYCQNTSENGFNYQWGFSPDQTSPIDSFDGEYTYTIAGNYDIVLSAQSAEGCNDFVSKSIAVVDFTDAIEEHMEGFGTFNLVHAQSGVEVYYTLNEEKRIEITVIDGLGRSVYSKPLELNREGRFEIPTETLAVGWYHLKIETKNDIIQVLPFVKN